MMYRVVWRDKNEVNYHSNAFNSFDEVSDFNRSVRDWPWVKDSWIEEGEWKRSMRE